MTKTQIGAIGHMVDAIADGSATNATNLTLVKEWAVK